MGPGRPGEGARRRPGRRPVIVFCGYANLDVVGRVPHVPRPDERVHAVTVEHLPGGMAANAAVAAARAGAQVAFAGVVGDDPLSARFLAELAAEGIDTGWTDRTGFLSTAIVLVDGAGRRSVVSEDDALGSAHVTAVADRLAADGGLLYLDGYRAAELEGAARAGVRLAVDLDGCDDPGVALAAMHAADHVVVGRRRLTELLAVPADQWAALSRTAGVTLVVTDGARGWSLHQPDGPAVAGPALEVEVVDDTGAGDCFTGTYLAALAAGASPSTAATRAGVAASLSCTVPGARAAPAPDLVDAALAGTPAGSPAT
ncbi:carbohydrate kinase family protein [Modestobacter marinus]|uniref:Ribokinase/sulfofructose kinase n=1 Tax=Modestobacter marinus TaxID=477641 RepID=A0A846LHY7_9ACTN|nr:PfkB family carbohydrate kinase [Modestobacter marinus]NIH66881.1 ribokinase/sulfofructose kinase [Modestobacter marinus]